MKNPDNFRLNPHTLGQIGIAKFRKLEMLEFYLLNVSEDFFSPVQIKNNEVQQEQEQEQDKIKKVPILNCFRYLS